MIDKIKDRITELKNKEQEKNAANKLIELEIRGLDERRNRLEIQLNANQWSNTEESIELSNLESALKVLEKYKPEVEA